MNGAESSNVENVRNVEKLKKYKSSLFLSVNKDNYMNFMMMRVK